MTDEIPQVLINTQQNFDASFEIDDTGGPSDWTSQWDSSFDAKAGISGLYFPQHGRMFIDNRGSAHHNTQWAAITSRHRVMSPVMPWTADHTPASHRPDGEGGQWYVETARSHGGLYQALSDPSHPEYDDVETIESGDKVRPEYIWAVVYTSRLAGIPPSGIMRYSVRGVGSSADPNYSKTLETPLEDLYRELRFTAVGLPEPRIDHEALAERGDF